MADDVTVDNGTLTDYVVATDDIGAGRQAQLNKLLYSADGVATAIPADANGLLVNLGVNNDVTVTGTVSATDGGGSLTVDGSVTADTELPAAVTLADNLANPDAPAVGAYMLTWDGTTWDRVRSSIADGGGSTGLVQTLGMVYNGATHDRMRGDAANGLDVDVTRLPALPAGTNNIGDVDVLTLPALVAGSASIGILGANSGVDIGDVTINNAAGASAVNVQDGGNSLTVDGTVTAAGGAAHDAAVSGNPNLIAGRSSAAAPADVGADGRATDAWYLRNGAQATVVTAAGALVGGDAANGLDVDVTRLPTLANVTTVATVSALTGGGIAHDGIDSGNPVKTGGRARTTDVAAVSADDRSDTITSLTGKTVTLPYALPGQQISGTTNYVTNVAADVIAAQAAGVRTYITHILVTNAHATVGTKVSIRDGTTVKYVGYAAAVGGGFTFPLPVPLRGTAATAWTAICGTTGADVDVSISGYTAAE